MASNDHLYPTVLAEIESGNIDKTLWAKAFALSGGAEAATKSLYIRYRVEQLSSQARAEYLRRFSRSMGTRIVDVVVSIVIATASVLLVKFLVNAGAAPQDKLSPEASTKIAVTVFAVAFIASFTTRRARRTDREKVVASTSPPENISDPAPPSREGE